MNEIKQKEMNVNRRNFLKLTLGGGAAAAVGLGIPKFAHAEAEQSLVEPRSKVVNTFCSVCGGGCAIKAHVVNDRIVHLEGNPDDQAAQGRLCVKAYAAPKTLYDPDRLKYPMKRTNPEKGEGVDPGFVQISWDEALELIAENFNKAIDEHGPESIIFFMRGQDFANRLRNAIGTPNHVAHQSTCFTSQVASWYAQVTGGGRPYIYDLENCKYIMGFGFDGLGKSKNMHIRNITRALSNNAKMVILDPYMSVTARKAHEWIQIKPGTDLAFALAMIHVIVSEGLHDEEYVENYTSGFEYLEDFSREYTPEWAEGITEVPAEDIRRIAREFATTKPAHIFTHKRDAAGPNYANSTKLAQAIVILNALVGTIEREGGLLLGRSFPSANFDETFPRPDFPERRSDRIDAWEQREIMSRFTNGDFATVADGILNEKPYPTKAALVRKYNVLAFPEAKRMVEAFKKLDFMAVCEIYPSEMAMMADVVLPEPHWLETSGVSTRSFFSRWPQLAVRTPVVDMGYDTKGFSGIIVEIAKAMGLGHYFEGASGGAWNNAVLEAAGTSWDEMKDDPTGLWGEEKPFEPREEFNTPSSKIELYSTVMEENGFDPLPTWRPRREGPNDEYPFNYLINRPPMHKMTESQNNTLVMELYGENNAILNRETAENMGIKDGDLVNIESRVGKIQLKAKLTDGIRHDCVCVFHGFGHWSRKLNVAYGIGANDGDLIPSMTHEEMKELHDPGAGACMTDFPVKVTKA
ncbi:MAG: twin-arginine translocation signal domain-containing protein [Tindallia sp. MSAO_Bac2]|nr:MAG: twin-arginine translocation signal domain-containing protein [Tindallia sp. MSAO_Bac2]